MSLEYNWRYHHDFYLETFSFLLTALLICLISIVLTSSIDLLIFTAYLLVSNGLDLIGIILFRSFPTEQK